MPKTKTLFTCMRDVRQKPSHLVIPDDHAYPGDNFRRYEWLSNLIMERQPEVIIKLGDSWDMASLCSYDKGKKSYVFKNIKDDLEAGHASEEVLFGPIVRYNNMRARFKKAKYQPLIIKIHGNHEYRVHKLLEEEPRLEGTVSMHDFDTRLPLVETIIPYMDYCIVDNIAYSHYFSSGVMGRPCASARALLAKKGMSCTMGHTHILDTASFTKPTGICSRALIAGSFHDKDHKSFAGPQVDEMWWNGVIYKHDVREGDYDLEEISIRRLEKMYS